MPWLSESAVSVKQFVWGCGVEPVAEAVVAAAVSVLWRREPSVVVEQGVRRCRAPVVARVVVGLDGGRGRGVVVCLRALRKVVGE